MIVHLAASKHRWMPIILRGFNSSNNNTSVYVACFGGILQLRLWNLHHSHRIENQKCLRLLHQFAAVISAQLPTLLSFLRLVANFGRILPTIARENYPTLLGTTQFSMARTLQLKSPSGLNFILGGPEVMPEMGRFLLGSTFHPQYFPANQKDHRMSLGA